MRNILLAVAVVVGLICTPTESFSKVVIERMSSSGDKLKLFVAVEDDIKGYGFMLKYNANKYEFIGTNCVNKDKSDKDTRSVLFLSANNVPGELAIGAVQVDGLSLQKESIVEIVFAVTETPDVLDFTVVEGITVDISGVINELPDVEIGELRHSPVEYGLSQNFPNPFNPQTSIEYRLPESGAVSLVIYNLLGQEVRTLVKDVVESGLHHVYWDGKDSEGKQVANGVYVYRMSAGEYTQVRRMMLLK